MSIAIYYITLIISAAAVLGLLLSTKNNKRFGLILKITSLALGFVFLCRYMYAEDAIETMFNLKSEAIQGKFFNFVALMIIWLTYSCSLLVSLYGFFKVRLYNKFNDNIKLN